MLSEIMREPKESIKAKRYVRVGECLYRAQDSIYYFKGQINGREFTRSLRTPDRALAQRRAADFRRDQERLDPTASKVTLAALCELYAAAMQAKGQAPRTLIGKQHILEQISEHWPDGKFTPIHTIKPSDCDRWLGRFSFGAATRNAYLWLLKDLFRFALRDRLLITSPADHLSGTKREDPLRLTPTPEQFQAIIASVRAQACNGHRANDSADFLEFLGLAGLGQAEASALTRGDVNLDAQQIAIRRRKTSHRFRIPIYPQLQPLLVRLCAGKRHDEKLLKIADAKKALAAACRRLSLPAFSQRSLRRMFITRALELGIDVKTVAAWQGHRDQGVLILKTYSHLRPEHSQRMAQLMTSEEPITLSRSPENASSRPQFFQQKGS
jgi:integrase